MQRQPNCRLRLADSGAWEPLFERTSVQPDTSHVFLVSARFNHGLRAS